MSEVKATTKCHLLNGGKLYRPDFRNLSKKGLVRVKLL